VDTKALSTIVGTKVASCSPETANKHTGYLTGGTSPFGLANPIPIYAEESILKLDRIHINGGERGFLVSMTSKDLWKAANPKPVTVGIK
jgi:prolyl-tRNA editing enzyme YbaK/EbsC (Cys-tRNA(Pro) deacylase)